MFLTQERLCHLRKRKLLTLGRERWERKRLKKRRSRGSCGKTADLSLRAFPPSRVLSLSIPSEAPHRAALPGPTSHVTFPGGLRGKKVGTEVRRSLSRVGHLPSHIAAVSGVDAIGGPPSPPLCSRGIPPPRPTPPISLKVSSSPSLEVWMGERPGRL